MGQNSHISAEFDNVSSLNLFNLPFIEPDQYCCCFLVSLSLCAYVIVFICARKTESFLMISELENFLHRVIGCSQFWLGNTAKGSITYFLLA